MTQFDSLRFRLSDHILRSKLHTSVYTSHEMASDEDTNITPFRLSDHILRSKLHTSVYTSHEMASDEDTNITPLLRTPFPRYSSSDWTVTDVQLSGNGDLMAITGRQSNRCWSAIDLFRWKSLDYRESPEIIYSKELALGMCLWIRHRYTSFLDDSELIVTCCCRQLELYSIANDTKVRECELNEHARCMTVREGLIYVGSSAKVDVFGVDLNHVKTITLEGGVIHDTGIIVMDSRLFMVALDDRVLTLYDSNTGQPLQRYRYFDNVDNEHVSVTVNPTLSLVLILWDCSSDITFHSLSESHGAHILFSCRVHIEYPHIIRTVGYLNRLVVVNQSGDICTYDVRQMITFDNFKETLNRLISSDECSRLKDFLSVTDEELDQFNGTSIGRSCGDTGRLLSVLRKRGLLEPGGVETLKHEVGRLGSPQHDKLKSLVEAYQKFTEENNNPPREQLVDPTESEWTKYLQLLKKQHKWRRINDVSVGPCGGIILSGLKRGVDGTTSFVRYIPAKHSQRYASDSPVFSREFDNDSVRFATFLDEQRIVTASGNSVAIYDMNTNELLHSTNVINTVTCIAASNGKTFIGCKRSEDIIICDSSLNFLNPVTLEEMGYSHPIDLTVTRSTVFLCTCKFDSRAMSFDLISGKMKNEFSIDCSSRLVSPRSISVNSDYTFVVVAWSDKWFGMASVHLTKDAQCLTILFRDQPETLTMLPMDNILALCGHYDEDDGSSDDDDDDDDRSFGLEYVDKSLLFSLGAFLPRLAYALTDGECEAIIRTNVISERDVERKQKIDDDMHGIEDDQDWQRRLAVLKCFVDKVGCDTPSKLASFYRVFEEIARYKVFTLQSCIDFYIHMSATRGERAEITTSLPGPSFKPPERLSTTAHRKRNASAAIEPIENREEFAHKKKTPLLGCHSNGDIISQDTCHTAARVEYPTTTQTSVFARADIHHDSNRVIYSQPLLQPAARLISRSSVASSSLNHEHVPVSLPQILITGSSAMGHDRLAGLQQSGPLAGNGVTGQPRGSMMTERNLTHQGMPLIGMSPNWPIPPQNNQTSNTSSEPTAENYLTSVGSLSLSNGSAPHVMNTKAHGIHLQEVHQSSLGPYMNLLTGADRSTIGMRGRALPALSRENISPPISQGSPYSNHSERERAALHTPQRPESALTIISMQPRISSGGNTRVEDLFSGMHPGQMGTPISNLSSLSDPGLNVQQIDARVSQPCPDSDVAGLSPISSTSQQFVSGLNAQRKGTADSQSYTTPFLGGMTCMNSSSQQIGPEVSDQQAVNNAVNYPQGREFEGTGPPNDLNHSAIHVNNRESGNQSVNSYLLGKKKEIEKALMSALSRVFDQSIAPPSAMPRSTLQHGDVPSPGTSRDHLQSSVNPTEGVANGTMRPSERRVLDESNEHWQSFSAHERRTLEKYRGKPDDRDVLVRTLVEFVFTEEERKTGNCQGKPINLKKLDGDKLNKVRMITFHLCPITTIREKDIVKLEDKEWTRLCGEIDAANRHYREKLKRQQKHKSK